MNSLQGHQMRNCEAHADAVRRARMRLDRDRTLSKPACEDHRSPGEVRAIAIGPLSHETATK
jgi:hypothetical protein